MIKESTINAVAESFGEHILKEKNCRELGFIPETVVRDGNTVTVRHFDKAHIRALQKCSFDSTDVQKYCRATNYIAFGGEPSNADKRFYDKIQKVVAEDSTN